MATASEELKTSADQIRRATDQKKEFVRDLQHNLGELRSRQQMLQIDMAKRLSDAKQMEKEIYDQISNTNREISDLEQQSRDLDQQAQQTKEAEMRGDKLQP